MARTEAINCDQCGAEISEGQPHLELNVTFLNFVKASISPGSMQVKTFDKKKCLASWIDKCIPDVLVSDPVEVTGEVDVNDPNNPNNPVDPNSPKTPEEG